MLLSPLHMMLAAWLLLGQAVGADLGSCSEESAALLQLQPRGGSPCPDFADLVASEAKVIAERNYSFAHEGPAYLAKQNAVLFLSNRLNLTRYLDGELVGATTTDPDQFIEINIIDLASHEVSVLPQEVWLEHLPMANGAFPDPDDPDAVLVLSQGTLRKPSGVFRLNTQTNKVDTILNASSLTSGSESLQFNSPNDIVVDPVSKALVFTDPIYGFMQGFRNAPEGGNWLWIYPPGATEPNAVTQLKVGWDEFDRPNGVAFASEKGDILLVTDSGLFPGSETINPVSLRQALHEKNWTKASSEINPLGPRTTYSFEVQRDSDGSIKALTSRKVVSTAMLGVPDGIKVDCAGNVYTGVANGVEVHRPNGVFFGLIGLKEGAANFVLVPRGRRTELVAMSETKIYTVMLNTETCIIAR